MIPPFADEMNKSRRMYSELARQLSARGVNAMLFDFYGTGDSEGLMEDASWQDWSIDIQTCVSAIYDIGIETICLMGVRTGALLATTFLNENNVDTHKLLLWQPVIDGSVFINQFLRLKLASSMMNGDLNKETTKDLKAQLQRGDSLEIAGYTLNPDLVAAIASSTLKGFMPGSNIEIAWIDIVADLERSSPVANTKLVEQWQQAGVKVRHEKVVGMPFWNSVEIVENRELIDMSRRFLSCETMRR